MKTNLVNQEFKKKIDIFKIISKIEIEEVKFKLKTKFSRFHHLFFRTNFMTHAV